MADNERDSMMLLRRGPRRGGGRQRQGRAVPIDLPAGCGQWHGLRRSGLGALLIVLGILCGVGASGDAAQESRNEMSPVQSDPGDTDRMTPSVLPTASDFCARTLPIRYWIVKAIPDVSDCADVTAEHLAAVTSLDLSGRDLSALKAGDFAGLDHLETLRLDNNRLTTLPPGVFAGLIRLETLRVDNNRLRTLPAGTFVGLDRLHTLLLGRNPGAPFGFIPTVERIGEGDGSDVRRTKVRVRLAQGAPFPMRVTWTTDAGNRTPQTGSVMIPAGRAVSEPFAVAGHAADMTVNNLEFMGITEEFSDGRRLVTGLALEADALRLRAANVCGRTEHVQDMLMKLAGVLDCADVTAEHLAALTELDLSNQGLSDLKPGDFAGLYRVQTLKLAGNDLRMLPAGVFAGLDHLHTLGLTDNRLTTLPSRVFAGLDRLRTLQLAGNDLRMLPAGVFAGLDHLHTLGLTDNRLTTLPSRVFAGLDRLRTLQLAGNDLRMLPAGMFAGLDHLHTLLLDGNPGAPFEFIPTVYLIGEEDGPDIRRTKVRVRLAQGAPFPMRVTWTTGAGGRTPQTGRATVPAGRVVSEPFAVAGHVADVTLSNPEFMVTEKLSDNKGWVAGRWEEATYDDSTISMSSKDLLELLNGGNTQNRGAFRKRSE